MSKRDWNRVKRQKDAEPASPKGREEAPLRGGSHVKPGPVREWKDMTPAERQRVIEELRPRGTR